MCSQFYIRLSKKESIEQQHHNVCVSFFVQQLLTLCELSYSGNRIEERQEVAFITINNLLREGTSWS